MGESQNTLARLTFLAKVHGLRAQRGVTNLLHPVPRWPRASSTFAGQRFELASPLYADQRPEERAYELGKIANLRAAAGLLDGVEIPAGQVFSFWRQLGQAGRRRGFVEGRMLQLGCVVPAVGGGLCQLSNALYGLALEAGCDILERHPHSHRLPGSPVHDATVAWNYIDLRFRPHVRTRLELRLTRSELVIAFVCDAAPAGTRPTPFAVITQPEQPHLRTCATCAEVGCSRHETPTHQPSQTTAYLVDTLWPEFDRYLQQRRSKDDWLLTPIDGRRWRQPQYAWSTGGFGQVRSEAVLTLKRSVRMRRLASQGAARQTELLRTSATLARAMAAQLPYQAAHLVIDQTLLPALWQSGALGGRTFDVLMRRLPIHLLHQRMDEVAARWPQSPTAADFRAEPALVEAEQQALAAASALITPHRELAALFPGRAVLLDWQTPAASPYMLQPAGQTPRLFYPGPTIARKGAYLLREALAGLPVEVVDHLDLVWRGPELEGPGFWSGLPTHRGLPPQPAFSALIQPAFVEDQPRALLQALAAGIPVITTTASGLAASPGVYFVDSADPDQLREAVLATLARR